MLWHILVYTRRSAKISAKYVYCMGQTKGYVPLNTSRLTIATSSDWHFPATTAIYIYIFVPDPQMHGPHGPTCKCTDGHTYGRADGHAEARTQIHGHRRRSTDADADASARWCTDAKYLCVQCVGGKIVQTRPVSGRTRKDLQGVLYMHMITSQSKLNVKKYYCYTSRGWRLTSLDIWKSVPPACRQHLRIIYVIHHWLSKHSLGVGKRR